MELILAVLAGFGAAYLLMWALQREEHDEPRAVWTAIHDPQPGEILPTPAGFPPLRMVSLPVATPESERQYRSVYDPDTGDEIRIPKT